MQMCVNSRWHPCLLHPLLSVCPCSYVLDQLLQYENVSQSGTCVCVCVSSAVCLVYIQIFYIIRTGVLGTIYV